MSGSDSDRLLWAVKNGEIDEVEKVLKDKEKDVNKELQGGRNALHFAADYGHTDVIELLLSNGADINKPDKHGISPLLAAIYENHTKAVELLIKKGADKNASSPDGQKYIDLAEADEIKLLLK